MFRQCKATFRDTYRFIIDDFKLDILTLTMALSCRSKYEWRDYNIIDLFGTLNANIKCWFVHARVCYVVEIIWYFYIIIQQSSMQTLYS